MPKFDVSAAAGGITEPTHKPKSTNPSPTAKPNTTKLNPPKPAPIGAELVTGLLEEAQQKEGTVQISVRIPPSLKLRLKSTIARAGMVQERFVAEMIRKGLDALDDALDKSNK